jgi:transcriptional regulator with XRE-family HTH domain
MTDGITQLESLARSRHRLPDPETRQLIRQRARVSQDDLAAALGVSRAAISRWETGSREPAKETVGSYVAALDALLRAAI